MALICAFWGCALCLLRSFYRSNRLNLLFTPPLCSLKSQTSEIIGHCANYIMVQFLFHEEIRK